VSHAPPRLLAARAPAKINLYLHVLGREATGYHRLDSLVAFAALGDTVAVAPETDDAAEGLILTVDGPFAAALADEPDNLVLRAARALAGRLAATRHGRPPSARIHLTKRLPVASGIGGGSSDAAATLRALARLWRAPPGLPILADLARGLGADVPMCLDPRPARAEGSGERLTPVRPFPAVPIVLVNPRRPLATAAVFAGRAGAFGAPAPDPPGWIDAADLIAFLAGTRNDLEAAAVGRVPEISAVLDALAGLAGCALARMSGSGATCVGYFVDPAAARQGAARLRRRHPEWWVRSTRLAAASAGPALRADR